VVGGQWSVAGLAEITSYLKNRFKRSAVPTLVGFLPAKSQLKLELRNIASDFRDSFYKPL